MKPSRGVPGLVRQHMQPTFLHQLKNIYWSVRLGSLGKDVYIDRNVRFERHPSKIHLGSSVILKEGARLCPTRSEASIRIGDWTTIGFYVHIFAALSVDIGPNCLIAPFCYLVDNNHRTERGRLIREQELSSSPIVIEEDVWIGAHCTVLAGVRVGKGSVVAAGSVVTQDLPPGVVAGGAPARVLKDRG